MSESEVLSQTIGVFETRFGGDPYRYPDGNRLVDLYMLRFQRHAFTGDLERAEEIARLVLPASANPAAAEARLALVLIARHAFGEALEHARAGVKADSLSTAALASRFDAAIALGRHAEAGDALAAMRPGSFARRLREARWLAEQGELAEAGRLLRHACERLGSSAAPAQLVAWCLTRLADVEHQRSGPRAARAWLLRALEIDPGHRGAIEGLASLEFAQGDWRKAEHLYRLIESDAHPDLYLRLAEVYLGLSEVTLAAEYEKRFLSIAGNPDAEPLFARELAVYLSSGTSVAALDRALAIAEREVARRPAAESHELLAWVRLRREEPTEALEALEAAPRWGQPSPAALYLRARALELMGAPSIAAELYAEALAVPSLLPHHLLKDSTRKA